MVNYIQEVVSCRHNRAGIHETVPARASRDPSVGVGMISHHELKSYWHVAAGERGRTDYYYFLMMFDSCYLDHVPGQAPLSRLSGQHKLGGLKERGGGGSIRRHCYHHHLQGGWESGQEGYECVNMFKLQYMKFPEN